MTGPRRPRSDDGSMLILMLGLIVVCALLIAVVVDASTLFLARMQLMSAADGAALSGAQAVDERALYTQPSSGFLPLDPVRVRQAVTQYLALDGDTDVEVLLVTTDGTTVQVAFRRQVHLPFLDLVSLGRHDSATVTARAAAQSPFVP
jgi:uncharacterized membrane protein